MAVNWHTQAERNRYPVAATRITPPTLSPANKKSLEQIANRLLRAKLEQGLMTALDVNRNKFRGLPSVAQLSQVRLVAQRALLEGKLEPINDHLGSLKKAKEQWRETQFRQRKLWDWLQQQSKLSDAEFKIEFGLAGALPAIGEAKSNLTEALRVEFTARLVDGLMKQAIQQKKAEVERG